jgi:hypothetical protein
LSFHWRVLTEVRMTVSYADHTEAFDAGDAFYIAPAHTPAADAGTEFIQFNPTDLLAETEAAIAKGMQTTATWQTRLSGSAPFLSAVARSGGAEFLAWTCAHVVGRRRLAMSMSQRLTR